jgi:hypothetical protein
MRKILSALLLLALAACGGGTVNCTGQYSCEVVISGGTNTVSVPGSIASAPAGSASSPSGSASSPTPAPAPTLPLAQVHNLPPTVTITAGDLRWDSGGITYMLGVAGTGDAYWVAVWSIPQTNASGEVGAQMATLELMIDSGVDLRGLTADDATLKAYVSTIVIPKLDKWMQANSSRWASGMTIQAVNLKDSPTGGYLDRLAGRIPQWIDLSPFGASMK